MDEESPGWDAITSACTRIYGDQVPRHIGYVPGLAFGSGLQGCSAYAAADHWHYVTYGLSELWAKEAESDPDMSGWGYEFTMRVAPVDGIMRSPAECPTWPFDLLESIARLTQTNGDLFLVGHRLDARAPITGEDNTTLTAVAFTLDPQMGSIDTPNGELAFHQVVGITPAELEWMKSSSTADVLATWAPTNPLLVTQTAR